VEAGIMPAKMVPDWEIPARGLYFEHPQRQRDEAVRTGVRRSQSGGGGSTSQFLKDCLVLDYITIPKPTTQCSSLVFIVETFSTSFGVRYSRGLTPALRARFGGSDLRAFAVPPRLRLSHKWLMLGQFASAGAS
jgi:hypothetical protein